MQVVESVLIQHARFEDGSPATMRIYIRLSKPAYLLENKDQAIKEMMDQGLTKKWAITLLRLMEMASARELDIYITDVEAHTSYMRATLRHLTEDIEVVFEKDLAVIMLTTNDPFGLKYVFGMILGQPFSGFARYM